MLTCPDDTRNWSPQTARLKVRLQTQAQRRLNHAVSHRRHRQSSTSPIGLGNVNATPWQWHIGIVLEGRLDVQKFVVQVCLECLKTLAIHTPCPVVRFDQCPGRPQIRQMPDLVDQRAGFGQMNVFCHDPSFLTRVLSVEILSAAARKLLTKEIPYPATVLEPRPSGAEHGAGPFAPPWFPRASSLHPDPSDS